jgi:hypothetical protein
MKAFWKSLTIWFNGVVGSLAMLLPDLMVQLPTLREYVPDDIYRWLFMVVVVGNVIIRARTHTAIGVRDA